MDRVGVQLGADDAAKYFSTLDRVNKVTDILIGTTQDLVGALGLLEKEEDRAGKGAKGLGEDAEQGSKKLSLLEQATIGATRRLGEFAVDGARMAAQAVLDFAKDGVKAAGDFESGMNSFSAVVGDSLSESGKSLDDFKQLFISLGRDLPVSTADVQQAAIEMAKGGIEPATIAAGGLKQTLQFAAAGGLELADAATIAAKVIGGWADVNATASEKAALLAHSTDLLARAANASTINVDELALGLYNVQGTARSAGVPLDETVTTLALLAPGFNSSAEAGNGMKNMLLRLQPATEPAAAAMADLGLLTKDGNSAFYDAQGNFIGMRQTADKLNKALGNLSEAQRTEALRTIFGNDALNAANILLQNGAQGYDAMAASMAKQMSVAEQARQKQQGFNTALDNLMGSLEALQITVFSRALPALTGLINLLASGINVITDYAEATANGQTALASIISFIEVAALPTIYGLTAALTAYAIVQAVQATPAILASLPAIAAQTAAFIANAAAVLAAVAPYVLVAAAVAGVAFAWNDFSEKIRTATEEMLAGKQFWVDSAAAIEGLGMASEETQQRLRPLADSIQVQRDLLEQQIESLGKRQAAGLVTEEQFAREMEQLNGLATAITFASDQLNAQVDAEARAATASMTATAEAATLQAGTAELGGQASLTAKEIEDLGKKIQDTYEKGQEAVQGYASNQASFLAGVEDRQKAHAEQIEKLEKQKAKATTEEQKKGIDEQIAQAEAGYREQEAKAAESYARQQAEQQKHLGQMLIDYTTNQALLGNIPKEKAAEITAELAKQYGLQETDTSSTFLKMASVVDTWSKDTGADADTYIQKLKDTQQAAADAQVAEDKYYQESAAAAAATFTDKGGNVKDYVAELENIPLDKETEVKLPNIDRREREVKDIHKQLDDLPTEVTIHINVVDNRPPDIIPQSPTAFEMGLRGIESALIDAGNAANDGLLSVLGNLDAMLPDLLGTVQSITTQMHLRIGEIDQQLRSRLPAATRTALENDRKMLEEQLDLIAGAVGELPQRVNDALASAYSSTADFLRQQADNLQTIFDLGRDPGTIQKSKETQRDLTKQGEDLDKQIAEKRLRLDDIRAGRLLVTDAERKKAEEELLKLEQQRADVGDTFAAAYQEQLDAEYAREEQLKIQKRAQTALAQAQAEASAMTDPSKAAAFLKLRTDQITHLAELEQRRAEATTQGERELIDTQISLEKQAQAADLKAFDLQQDQLGATQDLIAALGTLNDNLTITGDLPPVILALMQLIAQLEGRAGGGAMQAMHPYIVGEQGPELIVPRQASDIFSTLNTRRALASPTMLGGSTTTYGGSTIVNVDARGSSLSAAQITAAVWAGISAASHGADVRVRTGVG